MIPWLVCLATLGVAVWCDVRTRAIPAWLPVVPVVALAWTFDPGTLGWRAVSAALLVLLGSVIVFLCAQVGLGDLAFLIPLTLILGVWVVVLLAVSLAAGVLTMRWTHRSDGPFLPHMGAGFLLASGLRWITGG